MRVINVGLFIAFFLSGFLVIDKIKVKEGKNQSNNLFSRSEFVRENGWELQKDEDGIQIFSRTLPGSKLKQRKGTAIINSDINGVVALIKDAEAGPLWIDRMIDFKSLKIVSEKEWYTYSELEIPWPFENRDLITQNVISQDPKTRTVTITLTSFPKFIPVKEGKVRMGESEGSWTIEPLGKEQVKITYLMWSEAGKFTFPQAFITPIVVNSIHSTIKNMKKLLESEKYKNVKLPFLM